MCVSGTEIINNTEMSILKLQPIITGEGAGRRSSSLLEVDLCTMLLTAAWNSRVSGITINIGWIIFVSWVHLKA